MPTKKAASSKAPSKQATGGRKYSPAASASVEREMKALKQGKLRSGSGAKVTNPKQAIAIGLAEARREGDQAPTPPNKKAAAKGSPAKTAASTKGSAAKKSPAAKKAATAAKSAASKPAAKKTSAKQAASAKR